MMKIKMICEHMDLDGKPDKIGGTVEVNFECEHLDDAIQGCHGFLIACGFIVNELDQVGPEQCL